MSLWWWFNKLMDIFVFFKVLFISWIILTWITISNHPFMDMFMLFEVTCRCLLIITHITVISQEAEFEKFVILQCSNVFFCILYHHTWFPCAVGSYIAMFASHHTDDNHILNHLGWILMCWFRSHLLVK